MHQSLRMDSERMCQSEENSMSYGWLYIPAIIFFTLPVLYGIYRSRKEAQSQLFREYYEVEKRCEQAIDSQSISKVKNAIEELSIAFHKAEPVLESESKSIFYDDMKDLKDQLSYLETKNWQSKAYKHLESFSSYYDLIMNGSLDTFRDVDKLFSAKEKCLDSWHKYFAVELIDYKTTIYPKRHLREYTGDLYDPCMESSDALNKKLSDKIQTMRPEYIRKMNLLERIVDYVAENPNIQRSCLLKISFEGFTQKEVNIGYKALIQERRLIEMKIGNVYYVDLTDNERGKDKYKTVKSETNSEDKQMIEKSCR